MYPTIRKLGLLPIFLFSYRALADNINNSNNEPRVSWVPPPPRRSTWDIIWSCFIVYFFCAYYLVHLNLPRITESESTWHCIPIPLPTIAKNRRPRLPIWPSIPIWRTWSRRAFWMFVAAVVPEFTISIAVKEYLDARKAVMTADSVIAIQGRERWRKGHMFFSSMGGFLVKMPFDGQQQQQQQQAQGLGDGANVTLNGGNNGDTNEPSRVTEPLRSRLDSITRRRGSETAVSSTMHFEAREISPYGEVNAAADEDDTSTLNEDRISPISESVPCPSNSQPPSEQPISFKESAYRGAFLTLEQLANLKNLQGSIHIPFTSILDRSKSSPLTVFIVLVQCGSLLISSIARAATPGLTITQLELTTLTFLFPCLIGWFLWREKPFCPQTPVVIGSPTQNIFNTAAKSYLESNVPLKSSDELEKMRMGELQSDDLFIELILETIEESRNRSSSSFVASVALYILAGLIAAVQLAAWNWDFPSHNARLAWRVLGLACLGCVIIPFVARIPRLINDTGFLSKRMRESLVDITAHVVMCYMSFAAFLYVVARIGLFALSLYCLNSLPEGAYKGVDWTRYLVHFS